MTYEIANALIERPSSSVLVADAGYNSVDAHLMGARPWRSPTRDYLRTGFGYAYPEWYLGAVESPAKIAQHLHKTHQRRLAMGLKY